MSLEMVVETDLGHDPDDLFALCYLQMAGVKVKSIVLSPGNVDQIAIARFICKRFGWDIPIGVKSLDRSGTTPTLRKSESYGGMYHDLLKRNKYSLDAKPDDLGSRFISPGDNLLVIGPASNTKAFLRANPGVVMGRLVMQGGFLPYSMNHTQCPRLEKFEGIESCPTFNFNGDRAAINTILGAKFKKRLWVGKNVTHTIEFKREMAATLNESKSSSPGVALFREAIGIYLEKHDSKKFHDPLAAVLSNFSSIGEWIRGAPVKAHYGWTTRLGGDTDLVLANVDREIFWSILFNGF